MQLATSPMRSQLEQPLEILRGLSPDLVRQVLPIFDQLLPLYMDVSNGREEFTPPPQETRRLLRTNYGNSLMHLACIDATFLSLP